MSDRPRIYRDPDRFEVIFHSSPPAYYPEETHDTVQICIPFEGARFSVERSGATGTRLKHDLGAATILVIPRHQPHAIEWKQQADILSLHLSDAFLQSAIGPRRLDIADTLVLHDPLVSALSAELRSVIRGGATSPALMSAFATIVGHRIGASAGDAADARTQAATPLAIGEIARIDQYISMHLDQPIRLEALAELVGLTQWHFLRKFRSTQGVSPHGYIVRRRLRHACGLLANTAMTITEIALEVGMSHSHFSRTFHRELAVTPTAFRLQYKA